MCHFYIEVHHNKQHVSRRMKNNVCTSEVLRISVLTVNINMAETNNNYYFYHKL